MVESFGEKSIESLCDELVTDAGLTVEVDAEFGALTTYRVGGRAAVMATAGSVESVVFAAQAARAHGLATFILGRGSNTLVSESGFNGLVIRLGSFAEHVEIGDEVSGRILCSVGSAALLPVVARRTAAAGASGFEWAVGVPGSVGGAVRMNAGGHGSDMAAGLISATVLDTRTAEVNERPVASLGLGFRSSTITDYEVVLGAVLELVPVEASLALDRVDEIVRWRREHQPGGQNCGSVFVNPVPGEVSAGALIDDLGLRGLRIGSAHVSERHANFIQADPEGRADDVADLIVEVRSRVRERTGFDLRTEVRLVGFDGHDVLGV
ncbi:MAG: UDP-N-acetylmuramate dehydrogenase [Actinomycetota bacterium]|jgi:UDP-N-acetylmuramate dehydrogenase|nr:UDP-N-acetylmuramate dehydrogenase [Actinomycetota bacterium]MDA3028005.1 UDP-N-acetylmuramate dehydrogenase [Actinomycetota bacterium]